MKSCKGGTAVGRPFLRRYKSLDTWDLLLRLNLTSVSSDEKDSQVILKAAVNSSERDSSGKVALHYAAEGGSRDVVQLLVDADPSLIDAADNEGYTPLHFAVISDNEAAVQLLTEKGADLNRVDREKHSVVHWAAVCGHTSILLYLLKKQALPSTPDLYGAHALHYATQLCSGTEAKLGKDILSILLQNGANLNCGDYDERTPLLWAACSGAKEAVIMLLDNGGNLETVDRDGLSGLHCAASRGHSHIITTLISKQHPIDPHDRNGYTPLVYAVTLGHIDCAKLLLQNGANPNHQDKKLRTPAHCAAAKGQLATLKVLMQQGASLQMQNRRGDLPLHEAVQAGNTELVRWLVSQNSESINTANYEGRTCLHLAAANGSTDIIQLLLDKGANPNELMLHKDELMTALDVAMKRGEQNAVQSLQNVGHAKTAQQLPEHVRQAASQELQLKQSNFKVGGESSSDEVFNRRSSSKKDRSLSSKKEKRRRSSKKHKEDRSKRSSKERKDRSDSTPPPSSSHDDSFIDENTKPNLSLMMQSGSGTERSTEYPSISSMEQLRARGRGTKGRYLEEKRIFNELAHLKRMQIQYGRVQEEVLVKKLVDGYAKTHHIIPSDFSFQTFDTWEKFLYDQLKHLYSEERDAMSQQIRHDESWSQRTNKSGRFRAPNKRGNNARVDQLLKTYGVAPIPFQYSR